GQSHLTRGGNRSGRSGQLHLLEGRRTRGDGDGRDVLLGELETVEGEGQFGEGQLAVERRQIRASRREVGLERDDAAQSGRGAGDRGGIEALDRRLQGGWSAHAGN